MCTSCIGSLATARVQVCDNRGNLHSALSYCLCVYVCVGVLCDNRGNLHSALSYCLCVYVCVGVLCDNRGNLHSTLSYCLCVYVCVGVLCDNCGYLAGYKRSRRVLEHRPKTTGLPAHGQSVPSYNVRGIFMLVAATWPLPSRPHQSNISLLFVVGCVAMSWQKPIVCRLMRSLWRGRMRREWCSLKRCVYAHMLLARKSRPQVCCFQD